MFYLKLLDYNKWILYWKIVINNIWLLEDWTEKRVYTKSQSTEAIYLLIEAYIRIKEFNKAKKLIK